MKIPTINYQLSKETIKHIEKSTKCSIDELRTLSMDETKILMKKRGVIKEPNKIKQWLADQYKKFGEKTGLLKKEHSFFTHIN